MAFEIRVPRLGWSMEEGTFVGWRKNAGDPVRAGEVLFELENDKATQEVESIDAGFLHIPSGAPRDGDVVRVGDLLGFLLTRADDPPPIDAPSPSLGIRSSGGSDARATSGSTHPTDESVRTGRASDADATRRPRSTPRARRRAGELGVDWRELTGSGRGGRIRERDVVASFEARGERDARGWRSIPVTRLRRTIAEKMLRGTGETAPVTLTTRVDATRLVRFRARRKAEGASLVPSFTDIVARLAADQLRRDPRLAARWRGERIEVPGETEIHIGIAVDTEQGLVVVVVRNAANRSIGAIAAESRARIERARAGRLTPDDTAGGVFTITNLGAFGVDAFTPIVHFPESAVLGIGAVRREPVVGDDDRIVARDVVTLSLTFDHRVIDGAPAAKFLRSLGRAIVELDDVERNDDGNEPTVPHAE